MLFLHGQKPSDLDLGPKGLSQNGLSQNGYGPVSLSFLFGLFLFLVLSIHPDMHQFIDVSMNLGAEEPMKVSASTRADMCMHSQCKAYP